MRCKISLEADLKWKKKIPKKKRAGKEGTGAVENPNDRNKNVSMLELIMRQVDEMI